MVTSMSTLHVRPIIVPHNIAESHQIARRRKWQAQQKRKGREGEMEGVREHDGQSRLSHRGPELCGSLMYHPYASSVFSSVLLSQFTIRLPLKHGLKVTIYLAVVKPNPVRESAPPAGRPPSGPPGVVGGCGTATTGSGETETRALVGSGVLASDSASSFQDLALLIAH